MGSLQDLSHLVEKLFGVLLEGREPSIVLMVVLGCSIELRNVDRLCGLDVLEFKNHLGAFLLPMCLTKEELFNTMLKSRNLAFHLKGEAALQLFNFITDCICKGAHRLFEHTCLRLELFDPLRV